MREATGIQCVITPSPTPNTQHTTHNLEECSTSNTQHSTLNGQHSTVDAQRSTLNGRPFEVHATPTAHSLHSSTSNTLIPSTHLAPASLNTGLTLSRELRVLAYHLAPGDGRCQLTSRNGSLVDPPRRASPKGRRCTPPTRPCTTTGLH